MSDLIDRQAAIDVVTKHYRAFDNDLLELIAYELGQLPSIQTEPCEDAVSRRRLLSDLKELTAAWEKYPVMAEQIKGVETAIGYVETIPSAQPEQRWIPSGEKPPEEGSYLVWMPFAPPKHRMTVAKYCGEYWNIKTPISAWMPLPEPYQGGGNDETD